MCICVCVCMTILFSWLCLKKCKRPLTPALWIPGLHSKTPSQTSKGNYLYLWISYRLSQKTQAKKPVWVSAKLTFSTEEPQGSETYALWSMHSTTFPKAPSPRVSTTSSKKEKYISLITRSGNNVLKAISADYSRRSYKFPHL